MGDPGRTFALTLVDELARAGMTDACLAPGSRSAPVALALAEHPAIRLHVHLDERSASFFALGLAKRSGRPVAVLCTSGTAAANLHPAVLEASYGRVPLIVLTADRPPELRDTGAGQAMDQLKLYGGAVRWFFEVGAPGGEAGTWWRSVASRAWAAALGGAGHPPGPVHLNLAFREPLVPARIGAGAPVPGRPDGAPWTASGRTRQPGPAPSAETLTEVAAAVAQAERGLLVAGWGAELRPDAQDAFTAATGWPVLADPLSGARRGRHAVAAYDALLRVPAFREAHRPDLVLRVGGPPTSKALGAWLDAAVPQLLVDPDGGWLDPSRAAGRRLATDPSLLLEAVAARLGQADRGTHGRGAASRRPAAASWAVSWARADATARRAMDELMDGWEEPFEGRVARDLAAHLPNGATLVVASSMPVRDLEAFARPRDGLRCLANRGLNGIDGFVATTLGAAAGGIGAAAGVAGAAAGGDRPVGDGRAAVGGGLVVGGGGPVVALCGDLAFLHDASSVLGAAGREPGAVFVVCDNDGGGIFSFLPQAALPTQCFETLFATPHGLDLGAVAAAAGLPCSRIAKAGELVGALDAALARGGTQVLLVPSDRAVNVARHRELMAAVAAALATLDP